MVVYLRVLFFLHVRASISFRDDDCALLIIDLHRLLLRTETDYPYTSGGGTTGKCKSTCKPYLSIAAGVEVPLHNETALMESIAAYPLSLSVVRRSCSHGL